MAIDDPTLGEPLMRFNPDSLTTGNIALFACGDVLFTSDDVTQDPPSPPCPIHGTIQVLTTGEF